MSELGLVWVDTEFDTEGASILLSESETTLLPRVVAAAATTSAAT